MNAGAVKGERRLWRAVAYWLFGALALRYLVWRVVATLWPYRSVSVEFLFSLASFAVEGILILAALRIMQLLVRTQDRTKEADRNAAWWARSGQALPMVDILIPTYDECQRIVERAIVGAAQQRYPRCRVWVLDDGGRKWLEELCRECNVGYMCRGDNFGAKAGNLNAAVARLSRLAEPPEFLVVMDCDYVAQPMLVDRTLALMADERVGLVQTPQIFYNPDNFQASFPGGTPVPDALRFIYDTLFPSRDAAGGCNCSGTSFLVRASAVRAAGGFPTESVSEDILFSFNLRKSGWRIVYLDEVLSLGLATEGLGEYQVQRSRWGLGYMQVALLQWRAGAAGKSLWKRLSTFETSVRIIYTPVARTLLLAWPLVYWLTGYRPLPAPSAAILWYGLPLILLHRGYLFLVSKGRQLPFYLDAVSVAGCFSAARAAVSGLHRPRNRRFVVTAKGITHEGTVVHWRHLVAPAGAGLLMSGAAVVGLLGHGPAAGDPARWAMAIWTAVSGLVLAITATFCIEPPRRRKEARYAGQGEAIGIRTETGRYEGWIVDISATGLAVRSPDARFGIGSSVQVELGTVGLVTATVVRRISAHAWGLALGPAAEQRRALLAKVYSTGYVHPVVNGKIAGMFAGLARRYLGFLRPGAGGKNSQRGGAPAWEVSET